MSPKKSDELTTKPQIIWVYQQHQSALGKIKAISQYSPNEIKLKVISIDEALPAVIDEGDPYLPDPVGAAIRV